MTNRPGQQLLGTNGRDEGPGVGRLSILYPLSGKVLVDVYNVYILERLSCKLNLDLQHVGIVCYYLRLTFSKFSSTDSQLYKRRFESDIFFSVRWQAICPGNTYYAAQYLTAGWLVLDDERNSLIIM